MPPRSSANAFHEEAVNRIRDASQEILSSIAVINQPAPRPENSVEFHPSHNLGGSEIASFSNVSFLWDLTGQATGVVRLSAGKQIGWIGPAFQKIEALVNLMEAAKPVKGLVSHRFLQEKTCEWLYGTLERTRTDTLATFIAIQCAENIRDHEIWIPLFHTYSSTEFNIGEIRFRTISRQIMDKWSAHVPPQYRDKPEVMIGLNRQRSKLQGLLAATCKIRAEKQKATELARGRAADAVALIRFLSPANFHSGLRSHCALLGSEALSMATELFMEEDLIVAMHEGVHGQPPLFWHLNDAISQVPGVLEALDNLSRDTNAGLRKTLYESLILYSRHTLAADLSEKLVFVLAALESSLLRDGNEPIQKNLGERIAFLIGNTVEERKGIIKNVEEIYRIRSAFVHHGHKPQHVEALDAFLANSWRTFARLLDLKDSYRTRIDLINALEDRKMT